MVFLWFPTDIYSCQQVVNMTELVIIDDRVFTCDDNWDVTQKNTSQLLCVIQKTFDIAECTYTQIDSIAKSILETTFANSSSSSPLSSSPQELTSYIVQNNNKSQLYYQYFKVRNPYSSYVYIFYDHKSESWFSNCDLLSFWLKIHQGIELHAVQNRTPQYTLFCERLGVFKKMLETTIVELWTECNTYRLSKGCSRLRTPFACQLFANFSKTPPLIFHVFAVEQ